MRRRVGGIWVESGRIALIQRHRGEEEYFVIPGGGIEDGESRDEALIREMKEELGVHVTVGSLVAEVSRRGNWQGYYVVEIIGGEFGSGNGPEALGLQGSDAGTYTPVWISIDKMDEHDVRPGIVVQQLPRWLSDGWPRFPEHYSD